ncbi:uncharacterized protein E0L32_009420 [Thyridium curvatum]|uniref:FAD-binding domain-containing protein n=1 Tax=Thyridium curvatum TaxID=1093900 RepID=A0A507ARQ3_9PEZI|nr:uncharacterized protein E0L32_009420 [Thyridium curvatum]TPX09376.1 hypothetical protein E0L32_009420 [Thyridium curvatum]
MTINHVVILGAGPAGLAAALALARSPAPSPRVTVLELRAHPAPALGGTINLTPLAMRYLDRLGAGARLRPRGIPVRGIDILSLRTGRPLGRMWDGVDALRVLRQELVSALVETAREAGGVELRYGVRVIEIEEWGVADGGEDAGGLVLKLEDGEEIRADMLVGADGIHSVARRLVVEPERKPEYSGKAAAYGFVQVAEPGSVAVTRSDGKPAVEDTTVVSGQFGSIMMTFGEPDRRNLHIGAVMGMREQGESREGWKARGDDRLQVKSDILKRFDNGSVRGLVDVVQELEDWTLYPVYVLPPGGRWSKGRVLLIGDAAHAMPPQGESTGLAIEDGVLLARVLQRHTSRSVSQLCDDFFTLRQKTIDKVYKETLWRWQHAGGEDSGWLWGIVVEWMSMVFLTLMSYRKEDYFASDVDKMQLPE